MSRGSESEGVTWQDPSQELGQVTASQFFFDISRLTTYEIPPKS